MSMLSSKKYNVFFLPKDFTMVHFIAENTSKISNIIRFVFTLLGFFVVSMRFLIIYI